MTTTIGVRRRMHLKRALAVQPTSNAVRNKRREVYIEQLKNKIAGTKVKQVREPKPKSQEPKKKGGK